MQVVEKMPSVVILAGGRGARLGHLTEATPKPLIKIGGRPILWHILKSYTAAGVRHSFVAVGYKGDQIQMAFANSRNIHVVDTGLSTNTGGRVRRLAQYLPHDFFCLTYADGVSNVDIAAAIDFHVKHGRIATITAVRPPAQFGHLVLNGDEVNNFTEKEQPPEGWINGGFMVLKRTVLDWILDDFSSLECDVLSKLAEIGELMAFRHEGFWQCMDTASDVERLNSLWHDGHAPWRTW
jgi:glucose-1-phosphate cytidylyltransferase